MLNVLPQFYKHTVLVAQLAHYSHCVNKDSSKPRFRFVDSNHARKKNFYTENALQHQLAGVGS
jgi:hypothetical protein